MPATMKPATALPELRVAKINGRRLAIVSNATGGLITYFDDSEQRAEAVVHACNSLPAITAERDALAELVGLAITMLNELGHDLNGKEKQMVLSARAHKRATDLRAALAAEVSK